MKKHLSIILVLLFPVVVFSQNVEVVGGFITDTIDLQSGLIKNVTDPISAQDAATKGYVDLLEVQIQELQLETGIKVADIDGNMPRLMAEHFKKGNAT